jgi:RNA polymerase sigma factor (TIGR02999 family)
MSTVSRGEVTRLIEQLAAGDGKAKENLINVAYGELRDLAGRLMRRERPDHTLQPTALVHEAALRVLQTDAIQQFAGRGAFFVAMATAMRRVLIDHARRRRAERRQGDRQRVPLDDVLEGIEESHRLDLLDLDAALAELEQLNPRQEAVVVQRFFGGFTLQEISEHLGASLSTVEKDWRLARAWLRHRLGDDMT